MIDPDEWYTLTADHLHQRHKASPYIGSSFDGVVRYTIRRGETIFNSGQITARTGGRLVRPAVAGVESGSRNADHRPPDDHRPTA